MVAMEAYNEAHMCQDNLGKINKEDSGLTTLSISFKQSFMLHACSNV